MPHQTASPSVQVLSADQSPIQRGFGEDQGYIGSNRGDETVGTSESMNILFGRAGSDRLRGGSMDDDLQGGSGNDRLVDDAGMDHLDGGMGDDVLQGGAEADNLRGGFGNDTLDEGAGHGDIEGGGGDDRLTGGPGGDAFVITPDSGDDVITDFSAGPGMLDHLAVRDLAAEDLRFADQSNGVRIRWDVAGGRGSVLLEGVFKRDLAQDDFMFTADRQVIRPTSGDADRVTATQFIRNEGEAAVPPVIAGDDPGTQAFRFDEFNVKVGDDGNNTFQGTAERDYFIGLAGDDRFFGGAEDDDLRGGGGADILVGGAGQDHLKGGADGDKLYGGDQADSLMGEEGNDELYAGAGHDMLEGGMGDDILDGGDGADAFIVASDSGNDVVVGGFDAGPGAFDHIAFRDLTPEQVTVANSTRGGASGVLVSWNTDADAQAEGSIFLSGLTTSQMAQDDFMFRAGNGLEGDFEDAPVTAEGSRYIFQPVAAASVEGTSGNDTLTGTAQGEPINGLAGNDLITGGAGNDRIDGGAGVDRVIFNAAFAQASFAFTPSGVTVTSPDGVDQLSGIEVFQFTDRTIDRNDGSPLVDDLFYLANNRDVAAAGIDADTHFANTGFKEGRDPNAFFSTDGYLAANPNVRAANANPLDHYAQFGFKEGRDPGASFDTQAYLSAYSDVAQAGVNPLAHFLQFGQGEGRDVSAAIGRAANLNPAAFDAEFYLLSNSDVADAAIAAGGDSFAFASRHYEQFGFREGRDPNAVFDTSGYLSAYSDVAAAGVNPLTHYDRFGAAEGRDPSAAFDTTAYLMANADLAAAGINPMTHYLQYGFYEGRSAFDDGIFGAGGIG